MVTAAKHRALWCNIICNIGKALCRSEQQFGNTKDALHIRFSMRFNRQIVWMCHSRQLNTRINLIYKRVLRLVYQDQRSFFWQLLKKEKKWIIKKKKKNQTLVRSRHPEVFCKKGEHRNFAKFTEKHHFYRTPPENFPRLKLVNHL